MPKRPGCRATPYARACGYYVPECGPWRTPEACGRDVPGGGRKAVTERNPQLLEVL